MEKFQKILSVFIAIAMLIPLGATVFAADVGGNNPSKVSFEIEYNGYTPTAKDVTYTGQSYSGENQKPNGAYTKIVMDKGNKDFDLTFKKVRGKDYKVEVSTEGGTTREFNVDSSSGSYEIGKSKIYFWVINDGLRFKNAYSGSGEIINDNLKFVVTYTKKPTNKLYIVRGKNAPEPLPQIAESSKVTLNSTEFSQGEEVTLDFPKKQGYFVYSYIYNLTNKERKLIQGDADSSKTHTFQIYSDSYVLVDYLPNDTDLNGYKTFNFANVKGANLKSDYYIGESIEPSNFEVELTDGDDYKQTFKLSELKKYGLNYSLKMTNDKYFALTIPTGVTVDDSAKKQTIAGKDYYAGDVKFTVAEQKGKNPVVKVGDARLEASEGKYTVNMDADKEVTVEYKDKPVEKKTVTINNENIKITNLAEAAQDNKYDVGTSITVKVTAPDGKVVSKFMVNSEDKTKELVEGGYTFKLEKDVTLDAEFKEEGKPSTGDEGKPSTGDEGKPGKGTEEPGKGTEEPGTGAEEPGIGAEEPGKGIEEPGTPGGEGTPSTGDEGNPSTGTENPSTPGEGEEPAPSTPGTGAGGQDEFVQLTNTKTLKADDNGKLLQLVDNKGKVLDTVKLSVTEKPVETQTITVEAKEGDADVAEGGVNFDKAVQFNGEGQKNIVKGTEVKFTVKDVNGKRVASVKVNDEEKTATEGVYTFTINEDAKIEVLYVSQYELKFEGTEGGIAITEPENAKLGKFDKDTVVKFTVNAVEGKDLKSVKVDGTVLEATENVYSVKMDADKAITLEYEDNEETKAAKKLQAAKDNAIKALDNLKYLTAEEKAAIKEEINKADSVEKVTAAETKAAEQNKAKAPKEFEITTEPAGKVTDLTAADAAKGKKKYTNNKQITFKVAKEANKVTVVTIVSEDGVKVLKANEKGVYTFNITSDTTIKVLYEANKEIADAKEEAIEEVDKLDLSEKEKAKALSEIEKETEKDKITEKVNAAKTKAEKEKSEAEVDKLSELSEDEKAQAKKAINEATTTEDVKNALEEAKKVNAKKLALKNAKDSAIKEVKNMKNISDSVKEKLFIEPIKKAKTVEGVESLLELARKTNEQNKPEPQPELEPQPEPEKPYFPNISGEFYDPIPDYFSKGYPRRYKHKTSIESKKEEKKEEAKEEVKPTVTEIVTKFTLHSKKFISNGMVNMMDVEPFIKDERIMVPIRFVGVALGFDVSWDQATKTATLTDGTTTIRIPMKGTTFYINDVAYTADAEPEVRHDRIFLSISNVAKALGLEEGKEIFWDPATKTATFIYKK